MKLRETTWITLFAMSGSITACVVTNHDDANASGTTATGGTISGASGAAAGGEEASAAAGAGTPGGATAGGSTSPGGASPDGGSNRGGAAVGGVPAGGAAASGSSSGGAASGGTPSGGASSGGTGGEHIDADGRCRAHVVPYTTCPDNYSDPVPNDSCQSLCEGVCGGVQVQLRLCTPTQGCAYDLDSGELIGMMFGDDVKTHCDGRSYEVISGDWPYVPEGCTLTAAEIGGSCPMGAIAL